MITITHDYGDRCDLIDIALSLAYLRDASVWVAEDEHPFAFETAVYRVEDEHPREYRFNPVEREIEFKDPNGDYSGRVKFSRQRAPWPGWDIEVRLAK